MRITIINEGLKLPAQFYGGSQRTIIYLLESIIKKGHNVNLLAGRGTKLNYCQFLTYKIQTSNLWDRVIRRIEFSLKSLYLAKDSDIIHTCKFWPNYHFLLNQTNKPIIYRQGNKCSADDFLRIKKNNPRNGYMQVASHSNAKILKGIEKDRLFVTPNATDTDLICPPKNVNGEYLAYLGRLNYDKGIDIAVKISLVSGIPLKIAGTINPNEPEAHILYEEKVKPFIGKNIEFIGPINDHQKSSFLGNAICLLMPNRWEEPFGLVMIESLAAGTPVIGTNKGAIPEIIDNGVNGFVCDSFDEIINAIENINLIDRKKCRAKAVNEYSKEKFILNNLNMYETIIANNN